MQRSGPLGPADDRHWRETPTAAASNSTPASWPPAPSSAACDGGQVCLSLFQTAFAALCPDMPCTPGPGGVADEQMKTAGCGVL